MKAHRIALATLVVMAVSQQAAIAADQPQSGSPEAASKLAGNFMAAMFDVPQDQVELEQPQVQGDWARLQAKAKGRACDLTMHRQESANPEGWVVQTYTCTK